MKSDLVDKIMDYESGELDDMETLDFFGALISSGLAWTISGSYGRTAQAMIDDGWIFNNGDLNIEKIDANDIS